MITFNSKLEVGGGQSLFFLVMREELTLETALFWALHLFMLVVSKGVSSCYSGSGVRGRYNKIITKRNIRHGRVSPPGSNPDSTFMCGLGTVVNFTVAQVPTWREWV